MKEEEQSTSFLESFDDDEKQVAEILQQFSMLVMEYEYNKGLLPLWGSKALRSVLVNIPPPSNKSSQLPLPSLPILPGTDSRPVGNSLPPIPESLPSSSNAHSANTRLRPKKKSPKITLMKKRQLLRILEDELIQRLGAAIEEPQLEVSLKSNQSFAVPVVDVTGGKEAEGRLCRERGSLLEDGIGIDMRNKMKSLHDLSLIPKETLLMGCFIQSIQLRFKEVIYVEARRKRKLEIQQVKNSKRPCA
ncbi:hypothetical protein PVL29_024130 [Vitis rotundifolia]|uniref:Uncharacterized protein n=1 Tax=Vitis rotundifolia TaxID=103349 RepID=A0AA38YR24_VITRO|nr:hypothetical protein PVL29_024130 [Vitis rotundifolia]